MILHLFYSLVVLSPKLSSYIINIHINCLLQLSLLKQRFLLFSICFRSITIASSNLTYG